MEGGTITITMDTNAQGVTTVAVCALDAAGQAGPPYTAVYPSFGQAHQSLYGLLRRWQSGHPLPPVQQRQQATAARE